MLAGTVVTAGIDSLVRLIAAFNLGETSEVGKLIQKIIALILVVVGGAVLGAIVAAIMRRPIPRASRWW